MAHIWLIWGSIYGPYMAHIWPIYGPIYGRPEAGQDPVYRLLKGIHRNLCCR